MMQDNKDYGEVMPLRSFLANVRVGGYIDEDGYGYLSDGKQYDTDLMIQPSTARDILKTKPE